MCCFPCRRRAAPAATLPCASVGASSWNVPSPSVSVGFVWLFLMQRSTLCGFSLGGSVLLCNEEQRLLMGVPPFSLIQTSARPRACTTLRVSAQHSSVWRVSPHGDTQAADDKRQRPVGAADKFSVLSCHPSELRGGLVGCGRYAAAQTHVRERRPQKSSWFTGPDKWAEERFLLPSAVEWDVWGKWLVVDSEQSRIRMLPSRYPNVRRVNTEPACLKQPITAVLFSPAGRLKAAEPLRRKMWSSYGSKFVLFSWKKTFIFQERPLDPDVRGWMTCVAVKVASGGYKVRKFTCWWTYSTSFVRKIVFCV